MDYACTFQYIITNRYKNNIEHFKNNLNEKYTSLFIEIYLSDENIVWRRQRSPRIESEMDPYATSSNKELRTHYPTEPPKTKFIKYRYFYNIFFFLRGMVFR